MKTIGDYEVLGRLGRGGMATVYKVKDILTGRILALKYLTPRNDVLLDLLGAEQLCKSFVEEAKVMASLYHPNIASVISCGEHAGFPYIVLEYYSHSLGAVIGEGYVAEEESRKLSFNKVCDYLNQVLHGLNRLHVAGIIHRDIKPFNLMLSSDNQIKIIDFGLSRVRGEELVQCVGMQVGSPYYTAPEQRKDPAKADSRADLYSVGVMAYRMLTGRLWDLTSLGSMSFSSLPRYWQDFIDKATAVDLSHRYLSAEEMLVALESVAENSISLKPCSSCAISRDPIELRSVPKRILLKDIQQELHLDSFNRPFSTVAHNWQNKNDFCVQDAQTKLIWQRRGAGFAMNLAEAKDYIANLRDQKWQGRDDWRLPTMEELTGLLCSEPNRRLNCQQKIFSPNLSWIWSADTSTKQKNWLVNLQEGYVDRLDADGEACVCAVVSWEAK